MRRLTFSAVLLLAACGVGEERVAMPLTAPDGAHRLIKDFIEICSTALATPEAANKLAADRGWRVSPRLHIELFGNTRGT